MKKIIALLLAAVMMVALCACGNTTDLEAAQPSAAPQAPATESAAPEADIVKVGVVLTTSGLGDNNFNDMVYAGLEKAKADMGIEFDYAEPASPDEYTAMTYNFAQDGSYDLTPCPDRNTDALVRLGMDIKNTNQTFMVIVFLPV